VVAEPKKKEAEKQNPLQFILFAFCVFPSRFGISVWTFIVCSFSLFGIRFFSFIVSKTKR